MPAVVTHALFAGHILTALRAAGTPAADADALRVGTQGPDIFYFHRVFPWQPGRSFVRAGKQLHGCHPAALLTAFKRSAAALPPSSRAQADSYIAGFICHYALDRAVHPFVRAQQEALRLHEPRYAPRANAYHYRVESALDTLCLLRFTGRQIGDFRLRETLPPPDAARDLTVGRLYAPLFEQLLHQSRPDPALLATAPGDMRHAMLWMTDRRHLRERFAFRPIERLSLQGHFLTSLLRPGGADARAWDYANREGREWAPGRGESFFELYGEAQAAALRLIGAYTHTPADFDAMRALTGDTGFGGDPVEVDYG